MTDLDKLYLALAEVGKEIDFNNLCYVLGINSLSALKNYNPNDSIIYDRFLIRDIQKRVGNSIFKSDQLAQVLRCGCAIVRLKSCVSVIIRGWKNLIRSEK